MKTKNIVSWIKVLVTLVIITASSLKAEWKNVNHYYTAQNLSNIFSYNSNINIVLVNSGYSYLKTTNGGLNYSSGQISSSIYLKNIKILNENVYLALTNSGLYKTTNSGISWFTMNSPNAAYSSIEFLNDTTFYLCINTGSVASLYKTTNGGINWVQKNCPSNVSGISFVSEDTGFSVLYSNPYGIWKTTDGALTWQSINLPGTSFKYVKFISPIKGFCETYSALFRTTNNGVTWDTIQKDAFVNQIYFANINTGYYSGYGGVYKTTNSGISFFNILNASGGGVNSYDGNIIIASYGGGVIKKSTDGGFSWSNISKRWDLGHSFTDICFTNNGRGYIVSNKGAILKTYNSGTNWSIDTTTFNRTISLNSVNFVNQDTGFIHFQYTQNGRGGMLRTKDGCITFDTVFNYTFNQGYVDFSKIHMYNKDAGIFSIGSGIFYTSNGGNNWTLTSQVSTSYETWGFANTSEDTVFYTLYGQGKPNPYGYPSYSRVFMSTNKGYSWEQKSYFSDLKVQESYFINGTTGYFAGSTSFYLTPLRIWKTTNSGVSITEMYVNNSSSIYSYRDIYFPNVNTGYLLPYRTTNQGSNWSEIMPSAPAQRRIKFINSNTGFIVGDGDIIYKTTDGGGTTFSGNNNQTVALKYELFQNYPNPFNPVTKIKFVVPKQAFVEIKVFDILGREVKILMNENLKPGTYETSFNGSLLANGIYFYRMTTENFSITKRMVLIK